VADIVETVHHRAAEAGTQIRWAPPTDLPRLLFDPEGISRAVLNVVSNALDAVEERPDATVEIVVEADPQKKLVRVVVSDNGAGMKPETVAEIFDLFVSTKGSRGTGLGLTVSRKILREHGGDIRAESELGRGSRFVLEFPLTLASDSHPTKFPGDADPLPLDSPATAGPAPRPTPPPVRQP
jgi:signal transduction histidine kinase